MHLALQHYAPRRGRKRGPAMLSPSCQINRGQLANAFGVINRHAGIQVKNRAEIKTALGGANLKIKSISELRLKAVAVQFDFCGECFLYDFPLFLIEDFLIRSAIGPVFRLGFHAKRPVERDVYL